MLWEAVCRGRVVMAREAYLSGRAVLRLCGAVTALAQTPQPPRSTALGSQGWDEQTLMSTRMRQKLLVSRKGGRLGGK